MEGAHISLCSPLARTRPPPILPGRRQLLHRPAGSREPESSGRHQGGRRGEGGTWGPWPTPSACALLPAARPALLRHVKPVDGGAAQRAHVDPQLRRVLPLLQKRLGCPPGSRQEGSGPGHWACPARWHLRPRPQEAHAKATPLLLRRVWTSTGAWGTSSPSPQASIRVRRSRGSLLLEWRPCVPTTAPS